MVRVFLDTSANKFNLYVYACIASQQRSRIVVETRKFSYSLLEKLIETEKK